MDIDAVLFDLFHTLVDVNRSPGRSTAQILGLAPSAWNLQVVEKAAHHALGTVADAYESLRLIVHEIDPGIPEERIREAVAARAGRFRHTLLHPPADTLDSLARLRGLGLRTALISNCSLDEVESWSESPLSALLDEALFSCREGVAKPDPEIYRRAAGRLGVPAPRCLYVGDGGSREHDGARAAGMRTCLILGMLEDTLPDVAATRPRDTDWVVRTLPELVDRIAAAR